ncbi:cation:dicarboxylate symporter family transporter [Bifidobacterium catenulatum]|uniref:cation:dicarboxylate symporter family transporter n=1 Tax=Bifidobacterium catenulatum TaxID=1686 RepID=UPI00254C1E5C|nr:cation:dicarboxylase symporter family transporter [Bifidobacterium catenulatum]WJD53375.1 cation:dicarboxylase symporter family transporter [Bifidobacterium catenulatum]WJO88010.1 cation:dicarboxylase symporter family transporter [Bifidobacterium catenulatum]
MPSDYKQHDVPAVLDTIVNLFPHNIAIVLQLFLVQPLVSIGTVGVPGTATITATSLFAAAGLPIPFIAISQPISQIVDMGRTALNVAGAANTAESSRRPSISWIPTSTMGAKNIPTTSTTANNSGKPPRSP